MAAHRGSAHGPESQEAVVAAEGAMVTIHAASGRFSRSQIFVNEGLKLGGEADLESLLEASDTVTGMDAATPHDPLSRLRQS